MKFVVVIINMTILNVVIMKNTIKREWLIKHLLQHIINNIILGKNRILIFVVKIHKKEKSFMQKVRSFNS